MKPEKTLFLASTNADKLREFSAMAKAFGSPVLIALLPGLARLPEFPENAPTFAENAVGKALQGSAIIPDPVCADDSGLVVPALEGQPGVHSARYAGHKASAKENMEKLLHALRGKTGKEREAFFVCTLAVAREGKVLAVVSNRVDGIIGEAPCGSRGFGYDPVFYYPPARKTFAEISEEQKNLFSHRGKALRRLLELVPAVL
jgi:XTP/dITP diphosphohydrolase